MEHHANVVPWQMLCQQTGAVLRVVPITDDGELILEEYECLLSERTRLVKERTLRWLKGRKRRAKRYKLSENRCQSAVCQFHRRLRIALAASLSRSLLGVPPRSMTCRWPALVSFGSTTDRAANSWFDWLAGRHRLIID